MLNQRTVFHRFLSPADRYSERENGESKTPLKNGKNGENGRHVLTVAEEALLALSQPATAPVSKVPVSMRCLPSAIGQHVLLVGAIDMRGLVEPVQPGLAPRHHEPRHGAVLDL